VLKGTVVVEAANQDTLSKTELKAAEGKLEAAEKKLEAAKVELEKAEGKLEKAKKGGDENSIKRAEASCDIAQEGVATAQRMVTKLSHAVPVGQGK
jgi:predicted  nucleic acid-binding Zn-ribbon protein